MTDPKSERERQIRASIERIFLHCETSKNPRLAYSRACSKIGYMARDGVRSELHFLESALNERKHALINPAKAKEHDRESARNLRSFERAIRAELDRPREPPSTRDLHARIHRNLDAGQWSRARSDLDELTRRPDVDRQLPGLDTYSRSWNLDEQQFAAIQGRIERCNALAVERHRTPSGDRGREDHSPIPTASPRRVHDRSEIERRLVTAAEPPTHSFLEARGLSRDTLVAPRFRGTWKEAEGPHREVLFVHRDEHGLSGAEVKSPGFTGFTPGDTKGLWLSNTTPTDTRLVVTESAIDALSYHQVNPHPRTRYASTAGHPTAKQLGDGGDGKQGLLSAAISWMPAGSTIVAATDNDQAGHNFAARIAELSAKHPNVTFERHVPTLGKDWNDHLQALRSQSRAHAPEMSNRAGLER